MTITSTVLRNTYTGNNSATVFAYQFRILSELEILVTVDGVTQTLNSDYTVDGVGNLNGGNVTFSSAPASGASIVLVSSPDFTQEIDYTELDAFPADSHEQGLDRGVIRDLSLKEEIERSILTPQTVTLASNVIAGDIDTTVRALTVTTSGISTSLLEVFGSDIDVVLSGESSGDLLQYDGSNFVNTTTLTGDLTLEGDNISTGNNTFQGVVDVTNINAETSAGGNLRTSGGTNCLSWGGGGSANLTLGGNMSGGSSHKLVNMADPTAAQDYATKAYVDKVRVEDVATTSGTSVSLASSIPTGVDEVDIILYDVSTDGSDSILVQIGDSGGLETTGYISASSNISTSTSTVESTSGFVMAATAPSSISAVMTLRRHSGNKWVCSFSGRATSGNTNSGGGRKELSGSLDRISITTTGGTDAFDAGSITVVYK